LQRRWKALGESSGLLRCGVSVSPPRLLIRPVPAARRRVATKRNLMTHKAERRRSEGAPQPISLKSPTTPLANGHANGGEYKPEPPYNLEAEQALLGAILIDNRVLGRVADLVHATDFFDALHAQIYETAAKLIGSDQRADPITLNAFFQTDGPYLGSLVANATTTVNAGNYALTIRALSTRRQLILIAEDMERAAYRAPVDFSPGQQIAEHLKRLTALDGGRSRLEAVSVATFAGRPVPPREWHAKGLIRPRTRRFWVVMVAPASRS
jgi:DnaB-like helicase N terminal domain